MKQGYYQERIFNRMLGRMEKGSLTIELTLLMPVILGLFILIIFSGFILHDKCVVNKACMSAALRASEEDEDDRAIIMTYKALDEVIPGHLIGKWDYSMQVDIGEDEVRIAFSGETNTGSGPIDKILSVSGTHHSYECRSCRLREVDYLRTEKKKGTGYCL